MALLARRPTESDVRALNEIETKVADESPTVYVVDDDASMREAVRSMLRSVGLNAQTFASTREFIQQGTPSGPSCLVLDVRLPGVSGLDFQNELAKANVSIPIVFITGHADVPMTVRAIKAGAVGFLTKPFRDQDLLDAISEALERDRAMRAEVAQTSLLRKRFRTLTPREAQVMSLVVQGKANKEIAAEIGTSEVTVKVHRAHAMKKMDANSVVALVRMAEKLQLP